MLEVTIPAKESNESWDESKQEFVYSPAEKEQTFQLEHSLISISKWESKWHKPFFSKQEKTMEETIDYIRCMSLNRNIKTESYYRLAENKECMEEILAYLENPMTATTFSGSNAKQGNRKIMTSEVIYYMMFANGIPLECEKWHINRLITLIRVFGEENNTGKKMSKKDTARHYAALNAARKKKLNTRG